ncbi:hypothetical protein GIB67_027314 [Kingdonia uniflora]|uniref:GATA transcription factor 26 n=1 Tax=Kingdonia uniflora TaxID=39325 RepID=A0A7J7KYJ0_9MAGN|nr:hypothetical protein GIB67_027314 [Kingdonia uniflora]
MGKQGPCYHCEVTTTPLWRNGPPEKPVLCNACGSRWRTRGTLENYTPLHARAEFDDFEDYKLPKLKVKTSSIKNKEAKSRKRKNIYDNVLGERETSEYGQNFWRGTEEDTSNRSSCNSAISFSESSAQFGSMGSSELTGSAQSIMWETIVPSRKRTCVSRTKPSSVEMLTKDLCSILHEQQSLYFSGTEDELLFENDTPMVSVEIGHGSVLMKHPNLVAREESEASSFSIESKRNTVNDVYLGSTSHHVYIDSGCVNFPCARNDKFKKPVCHGTQQDDSERDKFSEEKLRTLQNCNSALRHVDLKDVVNFEELVTHFTDEEQLLLMKYLPSVDSARLLDSIKSMFDSPQFAENLSSFQQLLGEGVLDLSFLGVGTGEVDTGENKTLKNLALVDLNKSKWVERYNLLKDIKLKQSTEGKELLAGVNVFGSSNLALVKRPCDGKSQSLPEPKCTMRTPKMVVVKAMRDTKDVVYSDSYCFSPRSLFSYPDSSSLMLDCFQIPDDTFDQDMLLEVMPSNGTFAQEELLNPSSSITSQHASTSSSVNLVRP